MFRIPVFLAVIAAFSHLASPASAAPPLSLDEAVALALQSGDPSAARHRESAAALRERAVSDSQLPDPMIEVGAMNLPVGSFDFSRIDMTSMQIGASQSFPRGRTRSLMRDIRGAEARAADARQALRVIEIVRDTRMAWLDLALATEGAAITDESRRALDELKQAIEEAFAAGRAAAADVLRVDLEASLVEDKLIELGLDAEKARAALARFIGDAAASRPLSPDFDGLPEPRARETLIEGFATHPAVLAEDAAIAAKSHEIDLARQAYKPGFSVNAGYGLRGGGRSDLASIGVAFDVPLFPGKRQDRAVAAAGRERQASRLDRDAMLLDLRLDLERAIAEFARAGERIRLYEGAARERAGWTAEAALNAYQSGVVDFDAVVRARLAALDVELMLARLKAERAKAQAELLFLQGTDHE